MNISYSNSMAIRSRCTHCGSGPTRGFYLPNKLSLKDVPKIRNRKDINYSIIDSFYLSDSPKSFTNISSFSKRLTNHKIGIRYHQYIGANDKVNYKRNILYLCSCFKKGWLVLNLIEDRPHIKNRKSHKVFPTKIKIY